MHWCSFCFIKPLHPEWSIFFFKDRCLSHRVRWLERFERSMRIELLWLAIEKSEESLVPNGFTVFTPKFKPIDFCVFLNRPRFGGGHSQPADLASQPCNGDVFWYAHTIVVGKGGSARGMLQKSAENISWWFVMIQRFVWIQRLVS